MTKRKFAILPVAALLLCSAPAFVCVNAKKKAAAPRAKAPAAAAVVKAAPSGAMVMQSDTDSCAAAFATVMGEYLRPEIQKQFGNDTAAVAEFVRGVSHAFDIKNISSPYYMGVRSGFALIDRVQSMTEMGFPLTSASFCRWLGPVLAGDTASVAFTPASADAYLRQLVARVNPEPEVQALSPESQQKFLDEQKARPGVIATPSGLLFEVLTEGEGAAPQDTDMVRVTYTGRLADGTIFDQTEEPIQFPVNRLVPGFTEGLKLMKPGGEYRIFIPASLGYGQQGAAGVIPPGAALDFTVKLLDILPKK